MQDSNNKSFPLAKLIAIASAVLLVGGGAAWLAKKSLEPATVQQPVKEVPAPIEVQPETPPAPTTEEQQIEIAWLDTSGSNVKLAAKTVEVEKSQSKEQALKIAFAELFSGPSDEAQYTTTIPEETKLLGLETTAEGVKVNLSSEFTSGGGSAAMSSRLAQVLYTASSLDKSTPVWISVDGKPLENLGGEGITVSQPMTLDEFNANFNL